MLCANKFCVFYINCFCSKSQIEIDISGRCKDCLYIDINNNELETIKQRQEKDTIRRIIEKEEF